MEKKTITQNNLPNFWNRVQAYINNRLPKGALANKDIATIADGGTNATSAKEARVNLGITYGTEVPTETPVTGSGAVYFFEDGYEPMSVVEGGTGANNAPEALENLGVADYIVEQGIEGFWIYRKWNSGIAECWGTTSTDVTTWKAWGNLYEGNPYLGQTDFPTNLFVEAPHFKVTPTSIMGLSGVETYLNVTKDKTPAIYPLRGGSGSTGTVYYHMEAIGRWK